MGGVLLSFITSSAVNAAANNRAQNIKSHGIFLGQDDRLTQEVLLDSADLIYLANECDNLEKMIDGLSMKQNASIKYNYHKHSGTAYVTGGCIRAWHTHDNSCPYHYEGYCDGHAECISHGHDTHDGKPWCLWACINGHNFWAVHDHSGSCLYRETVYDCGNSPMNNWSYVCGKNPSTIESAVIVFD